MGRFWRLLSLSHAGNEDSKEDSDLGRAGWRERGRCCQLLEEQRNPPAFCGYQRLHTGNFCHLGIVPLTLAGRLAARDAQCRCSSLSRRDYDSSQFYGPQPRWGKGTPPGPASCPRRLQQKTWPTPTLLPRLLLHVLSIRLLKDGRQEPIVDADDLACQIRAPAVSAAGVVGPSAGPVLLRATGSVRQLHHHVVDAHVDVVGVDRAGPDPDGWETQFQGPEHQSVALLWDNGRGRVREMYRAGAVAVGKSGAGFHSRCQDGFASSEDVVLHHALARVVLTRGAPEGRGRESLGSLLTNEAWSEIEFNHFFAAGQPACVVRVAGQHQPFSVCDKRSIVAKSPSYEEPVLVC